MRPSAGSFSFISWCTPDHLIHHEALQRDCRKFNYPLYTRVEELSISRAVQAWVRKPYFVLSCLEKFERIAFLDAEARILKKIPEHWLEKKFLLPEFTPAFPTDPLLKFHTGFMVMDRSCIPLLQAWIQEMERISLAELKNDEINRWDITSGNKTKNTPLISEETCLSIVLNKLEILPASIQVAWRAPDNAGAEEMRLGSIPSDATYVLHPFLHHWQQMKFEWQPYELYRIFRYHFSGDTSLVAARMQERGAAFELAGWRFEPENQIYAPIMYWPLRQAHWNPDQQREWDYGL